MERKPRPGELKAQSLKVIGEALTQTYQDVVDQKIPASFVDLLETLARNEKSAVDVAHSGKSEPKKDA